MIICVICGKIQHSILFFSLPQISQICTDTFVASNSSHYASQQKLRRSRKSVIICVICGKIQHSTLNIQHSTFNIITTSMDLRSYTKQELALLYFPDSDPDVARAHLMRWIVRCTQLYEQLQKSGYNKNTKEFNPLQVSYIFFHLGEP